MEELGIDRSGRVLVEVDPQYFRPSEVDCLCADPSSARERLEWQPQVGFSELVQMMIEADMELLG